MTLFDRLAAASLPLVPRFLVRRLSGRYIAGEEIGDALETGRRLAAAGYLLTYDVLGEAVTDRAGVEAARESYRRLHQALLTAGLELNLSVKPTQMGLLLGEDLCYEGVAGLARELAPAGGRLRFEMEDSSTTDATLRVFRRLREEHAATVGCVLQSMLRRTPEDARRLLARPERPLDVRLVKGVYREPPEVAWQQASRVDAAFDQLLETLLAGGAFVGVATHDASRIAALKRLLELNPGWRERCEVQMLLGVQEGLRRRVREEGLPVRTYVPFGPDWHAYVLRRLRQNPRLARHAFLGLFGRRERLAGA